MDHAARSVETWGGGLIRIVTYERTWGWGHAPLENSKIGFSEMHLKLLSLNYRYVKLYKIILLLLISSGEIRRAIAAS